MAILFINLVILDSICLCVLLQILIMILGQKNLGKRWNMGFRIEGGGAGQRPFGVFLKIHSNRGKESSLTMQILFCNLWTADIWDGRQSTESILWKLGHLVLAVHDLSNWVDLSFIITSVKPECWRPPSCPFTLGLSNLLSGSCNSLGPWARILRVPQTPHTGFEGTNG